MAAICFEPVDVVSDKSETISAAHADGHSSCPTSVPSKLAFTTRPFASADATPFSVQRLRQFVADYGQAHPYGLVISN